MDLEALTAAMPFARSTGVRLSSARPGEVVAELDWAPEICTVGGILHGGALLTLADSAGAVCAFLNLPRGSGTATSDSTAHLFRPVASGTVIATARPLHVGPSRIVVQTDLTDDRGRAVSTVVQTQAVFALPPAD